jgi:hypothetical protein
LKFTASPLFVAYEKFFDYVVIELARNEPILR